MKTLRLVARNFAPLRRDRDALLLPALLAILALFVVAHGHSLPRASASFSLPTFAIRVPAFALRSLTGNF